MKCELTIIAGDIISIGVLVGQPKAIAQEIAYFHGACQADVNEGNIADYTILTEFNDEGVLT